MKIEDFQFYPYKIWLENDNGKTANVPIQPFLEFTAEQNGWFCTKNTNHHA